MDILNYLNSNSVRDYLRNINYKFNSIEAIWVINHSVDKPLYEKLDAYMWICYNTKDYNFPEKQFSKYNGSIHSFIKEYTDIINKYYIQFKETDDEYLFEYYVYSNVYTNQTFEHEPDGRKLTEEDCWKEIHESHTDDLDNHVAIRIVKSKICDPYTYIAITFTLDEKIISIDTNYTEYEKYIISDIFEEIFIDIPTPFSNGDIVTVNYACLNFHKTDSKPFILEIDQDDIKLIKSRINDNIHHLDTGDMITCGYFLNNNGIIYRDHGPIYIDLEYYNGEYDKNDRILKSISDCIKGNIDVISLLLIYQKNLIDTIKNETILIDNGHDLE